MCRLPCSAPILAALAALAASATDAQQTPDAARDWPQWRGPLACGASPHGDPPVEWSESKNVRWKVSLPGRGNATPIVCGDRVYILTAIRTERTAAAGAAPDPAGPSTDRPGSRRQFRAADARATWTSGAPGASPAAQDAERRRPPARGERAGGGAPEGGGQERRGARRGGPQAEAPRNVYEFVVLALDRGTGETVWRTTVRQAVPHAGTHQDGTFASASPVTDGVHVYAYFGSQGLYCLDAEGKVRWELDLGDMQTRNSFGEGSSPALSGDTLVVNWDHEGEDFIVALDKTSGRELWRQPRDEPTTWSTPLIVEFDGTRQVITPGTNRVRSYDLANGALLWEGAGLTQNVIPSPVQGGGMVYLTSGFRGAALRAVRLSEARGDIAQSGTAVAWSYDQNTPYVPSPLLYQDALYFVDNNRPILTCLDARTGEKRYGPQRLEDVRGVYASPVGAAGRVYVAGRDGETLVLRAGPEFQVLAMNRLEDGFDASPAVAGDELFLRGREHLYCIAKR